MTRYARDASASQQTYNKEARKKCQTKQAGIKD